MCVEVKHIRIRVTDGMCGPPPARKNVLFVSFLKTHSGITGRNDEVFGAPLKLMSHRNRRAPPLAWK